MGYFICSMIASYLLLKAWQEKKKCNHEWHITEKSNVLQLDDMGYPLRLYICKCNKCGKSEHRWIDVSVSDCEELESGKSVLAK